MSLKTVSDCHSSVSHKTVVKKPKSPEICKDEHMWEDWWKISQTPEKLLQNSLSRNTNTLKSYT